MREVKTVCRWCPGACGMVASIDDAGRLAAIRADRSHPMSKGYACIKGLQGPEAVNGPARLLRPLKRRPDGSFAEIPLDEALDEIADKLKTIIAEDGPASAAAYRGTLGAFNITGGQMIPDWLRAIGSPSYFTNYTIDQSAKSVTAGRMGAWQAGRVPMDEADVMLLCGGNPLLSISVSGYPPFNATKQMKASKARGMKLIVIDPRLSETAHFADIHLRPWPGEDVTVAAGLVRLVLAEGWHDADFCGRHVSGLSALAEAVAPFTPEYVRDRAGVPEESLRAAAALFARESKRGLACTGTGTTMAPDSNLADHLVEALNVVCGYMRREGDPIRNPGVLSPRRAYKAQVVPPYRSWEHGPKGRGGYGVFGRWGGVGEVGQMMTATLPDEILEPGPGRIRSLIVQGGNPAMALPDQRKAVEALRALDLLVTIDPYMTATARLSHYVLAPKVQYERCDVLFGPYEQSLNPLPFQQFIPPVVDPPPGAQVIDDWRVYWELAKRLGATIEFGGVALDMRTAPRTEDLLAILARGGKAPFDEVRACTEGRIFDVPPQWVEAADPACEARFQLAPDDVVAEIRAALLRPPLRIPGYSHLLTVRRMREVFNSFGQQFTAVQARTPHNPACLHPTDMAALAIRDGDRIALTSPHGRIEAFAEADDSLLPGTVSISHGWGGLPDDGANAAAPGVSTNLLIALDAPREAINAMPWMSAAPVSIEKVG